jgi:hypothetical protein
MLYPLSYEGWSTVTVERGPSVAVSPLYVPLLHVSHGFASMIDKTLAA